MLLLVSSVLVVLCIIMVVCLMSGVYSSIVWCVLVCVKCCRL